MSKDFKTADVLSVTTGLLCGDMGGVYEILDYMTGDDLCTHQLGRASLECAPFMLAQHPQIAGISPEPMEADVFGPWLAVLALHSTLYDGWRHLYFSYPCLLYFSALGLLAAPTPAAAAEYVPAPVYTARYRTSLKYTPAPF